ncbi:MAG: SufD family Fe-S cluster assembly protein [Pseudomonadota bacterium]
MTDDRQAAQRAEATETLLAGAAEDAGAGALARLKSDATDRFRALGAPMPRDEYWRYLSPSAFNEKATPAERSTTQPAAGPKAPEASPFAAAEPLTLCFVEGRFEPALSDDPAAAGDALEIAVLSAGAAPDWASEQLGALERLGQSPVPRPLAALNGALATDGVAIRVTGEAVRPVEIRYLGDTDGGVHLRHLAILEDGASLTLLETGVGAARYSTVLEAEMKPGAAFDHLRLQTDPRLRRGATHLFARIAAEASFKSFTLAGAGDKRVIRNEGVLWMEGDDASAHIAGGVVGKDDAKIDNTVFLTHGALRGESRQVFKNVLSDKALGVFQGKILVREGAQQTDGYQISQSVLLSERAAFNAKPELEIYADDVKCSHGSTTGALDEGALFYLRSRGVEPAVARRLLIEAFLEEAVEEIADETLADVVRDQARALVVAAIR